MSQKNYNTDIIELQDKTLLIDAIITEGNTKTLRVSKPRELSNKACKHCGSLAITVHNYHIRKIKFLDVASFKTNIEYKQRRFICNDCNKTFNEDTNLVEKGSNISNQTKIKLLEKLRDKTSFTEVAKSMDVSITTAINEFEEHAMNYRCKLTKNFIY